MAYAVGGGVGLDIKYRVKMDQVIDRMNAMGNRWKAEAVAMNREAAKIVQAEWKTRAPFEHGDFIKASRVGASARDGYVALRNTGGRSNDHIGVTEFGGTIPRFQGKAADQEFTHVKPHIKEGYFLVPSLEHERNPVIAVYQRHLNELAAKYLP